MINKHLHFVMDPAPPCCTHDDYITAERNPSRIIEPFFNVIASEQGNLVGAIGQQFNSIKRHRLYICPYREGWKKILEHFRT